MVILDSKGKRVYRSVVFDVETTGLSTRLGDRVIEIGAVAIEGKKVVEEFYSLIHTTQPINPFAYAVHGISEDMLQGQPSASKVIPNFHKFIQNSVLVAHNASFDVRFIQHEFDKQKLKLNNICFCTLKLGRSLYPKLESHDLLTLYRQFYKKHPGRLHRALEDARATANIWIKMSPKIFA